MSVRCPKCGHENSAGMKFCTNCGNSLAVEPEPFSVQTPFPQPPTTGGFQPLAPMPGAKKRSSNKLALFGGIGCLGLLILGIVGIVGLIYWTRRERAVFVNANTNVSNNNSASNNRNAGNSNSGAKNPLNTNTSNNNAGSPLITDEQFQNFLPSSLGAFEQRGGTQQGNVTEDFPGADRIVKSDYAKGAKTVKVVLAQFSSPGVAKSSYGFFLDGFKKAGAKVLVKNKVRNKSKVETGEVAIYTYGGVYETMFYADRFGFRITAPDRNTLVEYLKAFSNYANLFEES